MVDQTIENPDAASGDENIKSLMAMVRQKHVDNVLDSAKRRPPTILTAKQLNGSSQPDEERKGRVRSA